jgi:hypothetical protein
MAGKLQYGPNDYRFNQKPLSGAPILGEAPGVESLPTLDPIDSGASDAWYQAEQRIKGTSKRINPFHGTAATRTDFIPEELSRKYKDLPYGYIPGIDNDDFYSDTDGFWKTLGKGALRIPTLVTTKLGQSLGFLGSIPYEGISAIYKDGDQNVIANAADNAFSNYFKDLEETVKTDWLPTYNSAADRNKGFFGRMFTDMDFWADDVVDGAAFMAAAWIPGIALNKIGAGKGIVGATSKVFGKPLANPSTIANVEAVGAGVNYFQNAQKIASGLDKFTAWTTATASEALFEASGIKDNVYKSLTTNQFGQPVINPLTGDPYTEDEKKRIAGNSAYNGFFLNAALLGVTNLFELPYVTKQFGKVSGMATGLRGGAALGEDLAAKTATGKWGKFLESNYGAMAKGLGAGILREGLVEENAQLAIQRLNEFYGANGMSLDVLDYRNYGELGKQLGRQTIDAFKGDDQETAMNIGLGGLLGGGMSTFGPGGSIAQAKRDKITTDQAVDMYNQTQANWLKFGNIYKEELVETQDENGNPITEKRIILDEDSKPLVDEDKLAGILSSVKAYGAKLNLADEVEDGNPFLRNYLRDDAFRQFTLAHINAGNEDTLMGKLDSLRNAKPEDLAKLGFVQGENFEADINRYKGIAAAIIAQNKAINSDIIFDNTKEDQARKAKLTELASTQAVLRGLASEELRNYENVKSQFVDSTNSSLSDGLVDQLNDIQFRIDSQEEYIKNLKESGVVKPAQLALHEDILDELKSTQKDLLKYNETSAQELKKDDAGYYSYEKKARNEAAFVNPMNKRMRIKGQLENTIAALGREWGLYADFKTGKKNFLDFINEQVVEPVNKTIEENNALIPDENLVDNVDIDGMDAGPAQNIELGKPSLDSFLRDRHADMQAKGTVSVDYNTWLNSGDANNLIKYYNQKYGTTEPLVGKPQVEEEIEPELVTEDQADEVPQDVMNEVLDIETEDELPEGELGTTALSSVKLGPYVVNLGDEINGEEVTSITDKIIQLGDNILSYDEVRSKLDAFKGRNIKRKGETAPVESDTLENGEIKDVVDSKADTITQNKNVQNLLNKDSEGVLYGGSDKVIDGGSKVNNTSELYITDYGTANKRVDRKRVGANPNYPMVLGTSTIGVGTNLSLTVDLEIEDFKDPNREDSKTRKASDFFEGSKIKESAMDDFPIRIEAEINDQPVLLGYYPTVKWLEERWPDGTTKNVVEFITTPDGQSINNLAAQVEIVKNLRKEIFEGHNFNSNFGVTAIVNGKSNGKLRLNEDGSFNKLSKVLHPSTRLGIIRNGMVHLGNDVVAENVITDPSIYNNREGRPVALITTPTGKSIVSLLTVPKLAPTHQELIVSAWSAFHAVKNAADPASLKDQVAIVKAIYDTFDTPFEPGTIVDFNVLRNYINDYVTFTSSKQYNPLLKPGTSQLNITEAGELIAWSVKDKSKDKDVVIAKNPAEFAKKQDQMREKLSDLYYNAKTTTEFSQGINSESPMTFLSVVGGKLVKSPQPITYNEYMMNILETNIEKGRPVDSKDPNSPFVHFSNPVVTFDVVDNNLQSLEVLQEEPSIPAVPVEDNRPIEYGEVFVTGTILGQGDVYGNVPKYYPDRRGDNEYNAGTKKYFKEEVIQDKKIFTLVDASIVDTANRKGFVATSILVDKNSPTTLNDVKADLEAIHARTMSGVESDRKVNKAKVTQALTGVRWASRKETPAVKAEELLDLSLDFGDVAEDIGNIDDMIEPDMKSIKTSLKELKKSCD